MFLTPRGALAPSQPIHSPKSHTPHATHRTMPHTRHAAFSLLFYFHLDISTLCRIKNSSPQSNCVRAMWKGRGRGGVQCVLWWLWQKKKTGMECRHWHSSVLVMVFWGRWGWIEYLFNPCSRPAFGCCFCCCLDSLLSRSSPDQTPAVPLSFLFRQSV